jgi:hypothetical protein
MTETSDEDSEEVLESRREEISARLAVEVAYESALRRQASAMP